MTMQWEGHKREDGQLDASYCRILFYLTLERLEETIVDLQIQNRVVTISIFNEKAKPKILLELLYPALKKALGEYDYQLLSVSWKQISDIQEEKGKPSFQQPIVGYQGVDLRI
jgi:hypothetical protein